MRLRADGPLVGTYVIGIDTWQEMARPERFELPTSWFVARHSIQLSYGRALSNSDRTSRDIIN